MNKSLLLLIISFFISSISFSQIHFAKQWDHTFGGSDFESLEFYLHTSDGGFLLAGYTKSDSSGEVSELTRGGSDFWIVKTDSSGNKLWDKRFGGSLNDQLYSACQTTDGGYILGGFTGSDSGSGDVSQASRGGLDYWIVKTDSFGNKLWDKRYGGNGGEWLNSLQQTSDGGYILGGYTLSDSSGDVSSHSQGGEDFWLVKTDASGIIQWDKRFGGNSNDELNFLQQIPGGGYILGGTTASDSGGDVSQNNRGLTDYWVVKTDPLGNKLWDKRFGGSGKDIMKSLQRTSDAGYVFGGWIRSDTGGDVSEHTRDTSLVTIDEGDYWIVKTDSNGNKLWDKRYGGSWVEDAYGFTSQTPDGGYLFGGSAYSGMSGDKSENNFGYEQSWMVRTDSAGNKLWDKTVFTDQEDENAYVIGLPGGCYVIANSSYADSAGEKTQNSRGQYDYWFIKYCETAQPQLPIANFSASNNSICSGGCFSFTNQSINAGTFLWDFPGATPSSSTLSNPTNICYSDTGFHTVSLIAINSDGSDTVVKTNIIYVNPNPVFVINRIGDTLFAPQGYSYYIWSFNNIPNVNDSNYYLIPTIDGNYSVYVVDSNGCPGSDTLLVLNVNIREFTSRHELNVYPNPAKIDLHISGLDAVVGGDLRIEDMTGRLIDVIKINSADQVIPVSMLKPGIYFIEAFNNHQKYFARFVKE